MYICLLSLPEEENSGIYASQDSQGGRNRVNSLPGASQREKQWLTASQEPPREGEPVVNSLPGTLGERETVVNSLPGTLGERYTMVGIPPVHHGRYTPWYICLLYTPGYTDPTPEPATVHGSGTAESPLTALRHHVAELIVRKAGLTVTPTYHPFHCWASFRHPFHCWARRASPYRPVWERDINVAQTARLSFTRFTVGEHIRRCRELHF